MKRRVTGSTLANFIMLVGLVVAIKISYDFYTAYSLRKTITKIVAFAEQYKEPIEAFYARNKYLPGSKSQSGINYKDPIRGASYIYYPGAATPIYGTMNIILSDEKFMGEGRNKWIVLRANVKNNKILWSCDSTNVEEHQVEDKYLPNHCKHDNAGIFNFFFKH